MSMVQFFEEQDYSLSARYERFDGFDTRDRDYDHDDGPVVTVLARQRTKAGRLILERADFGRDVLFTLCIQGTDRCIYVGEDEAEARKIAKNFLN